MSATAFAAVQAAIMAALTGAPAMADGHVYANRLRPIAANVSTAVVVRLDQTQADEVVRGANNWTSTFAVECYARAAAGADPASAVDALLMDTWARLQTLDLIAIGALRLSDTPRIDWQYDDADTPVACAVIYFAVVHRTPCTTLSPWI